MKLPTLTEKHNIVSETKFQLKSFLLIRRRQIQNVIAGTGKFFDKGKLKLEPVISFSESGLWNKDDTAENWILTAGKIENLRIAALRLNGIEVSAGAEFSFWKHLGNPTRRRGYVLGREIREGCIVPTIAGGLCQLSNALYDAALKANFEILERHRHSQVIKGSLAEQDRDATVKWNYVDLRFKSIHAFRIEAALTADKLIVKFRSHAKNSPALTDSSPILQQSNKLNDCFSCGNLECFKHPGQSAIKKEAAITTFIVDEKWSEYERYIQSVKTSKDFIIDARSFSYLTLKRKIRLRLTSSLKQNVFSQLLQQDKQVAKLLAKKIPLESTHLVISQNLLPFLWHQGVLGGRTFDVLMTRLPMEKLHQRLDMAHRNFPESPTLNDFRAPYSQVELENIALTQSRYIITPHSEIAGIFINKAIKLDWTFPSASKTTSSGNKILFPASALGRKGAYEVKRLAKELNLAIVLTGKATEKSNFWEDIKTEQAAENPFNNISIIVYPAYVEHQPRLLLKALATGIPVITTAASGLSPMDNLTIIPVGDYQALKDATVLWLKRRALIAERV